MPAVSRFQSPNLSDDQVLRVVAGIRPCRRGGLRLEIDQIESKPVIHNYGHGGCGITLSMGTAIAAGDLLDSVSSPGSSVAVLGAGVVGLTTARLLAQRGYAVNIYAQQMGTQTLSALAGALFLPVGIESEHPDIGKDRFLEILQDSKSALMELDPVRYGIEELPVYEPAFVHDEEFLFGNGTIDPPLPLDRLPLPGPPRSGQLFTTLFIHTLRFLDALLGDCRDAGIEIHERVFTDQHELNALPEDSVVNCLALGSRTLFDDQAMYPARGVLVHMNPQKLGYIVHDGYRYMFPREDALILGGCFDEGVWDDTPNEEIAREILAHHRRFFAQS